MRDESDYADRMRAAASAGEALCLPVDWMPPRRNGVFGGDGPWEMPQPVRVYVPVAAVDVHDRASVRPYGNARPLSVPWERLMLARDVAEADPETLRQVLDAWPREGT